MLFQRCTQVSDSHSSTRSIGKVPSLAKVVAAALEYGGELWWPELAPQLVADQVSEHDKTHGLALHEYSTSGLLGEQALAFVHMPVVTVHSGAQTITLEALAAPVESYFALKGVAFYSATELNSPRLTETLTDALALIGVVPTLLDSVLGLVKSMHVLDPDDAASDVSFSKPELPFSIFVSVPRQRVAHDSFRVAEAIVHEAMHLQLSLVEQRVPLVCGDEGRFYSPWKEEPRNTAGILHGLYVFAVIDEWLERLPASLRCDYTDRRRAEIEWQINLTQSFSEAAELTPGGRTLSCAIMSRFARAGLSVRNV